MLTGTAPITAVRSIPMTSFTRSRRNVPTWFARVLLFWHAGSGAPAASVEPLIVQDKVDPLHTCGSAPGIPPREEPATRRRSTRATRERPFSWVDAALILL